MPVWHAWFHVRLIRNTSETRIVGYVALVAAPLADFGNTTRFGDELFPGAALFVSIRQPNDNLIGMLRKLHIVRDLRKRHIISSWINAEYSVSQSLVLIVSSNVSG
jgi:hypothetical protein